MKKKLSAVASATLATMATDAVPRPLLVAYHQGPPEIGYAGLAWRRGVAKEITAHTWTVMNNRADFPDFDFRQITPDQPAAKE